MALILKASLLVQLCLTAKALSSRKHFITFASKRHEAGALRNVQSAPGAGFDKVKMYTPADFDDGFARRNAQLLAHQIGFGFWSWKP
jgi:hypothetical protein